MKLKEIAGPERIAEVVGRLASEIDRDYEGRTPVLVGVLKSSFIFLSDLVRKMQTPVEIDFIRAGSYGTGCESSGEVCIKTDLEIDVQGRDVIVVEDIVDTGFTLMAVLGHIEKKCPASLKSCALLDKPSRRKVGCAADYVGMEVPDRFVVGYGLDCAERYRGLEGLYEIRENLPKGL